MNTTDKPRADSKLKTLPDDRQADIAHYATDHTLAETITWLAASGVETSSGPLSRFLSWYRLRQQLAHNQSAVQELLASLTEQNPAVTPEQLDDLGQKFFLALALEKRDPRAWYLAQQIACRKAEISLQLQKFSDMVQVRKDAQTVIDSQKKMGPLTPETLDKIIHELHLM